MLKCKVTKLERASHRIMDMDVAGHLLHGAKHHWHADHAGLGIGDHHFLDRRTGGLSLTRRRKRRSPVWWPIEKSRANEKHPTPWAGCIVSAGV